MPSLKKSALSLFAIQLANQALPLLTLPIVTRALGADEFGRMSFVLAVVTYAALIADYGFNLSATAAISVCREDRMARSRLFWETITVKALLAASCGALLVLAMLWLPRVANDRTLYAIAFGNVASSVLTPTWYYHGVERLHVLGAMTLVTRAIAVPATVWLVLGPADTALALGITVTAALASAGLSLGYLLVRKEVAFVAPAFAGLRTTLGDGWHVFISTAAISLYTNSTTVLLGVLANNQAVALFVAAEKVVKASYLVLTPVSQALYPRISYLMSQAREEAFALIRRSSVYVVSIGAMLALMLGGLAPWIIDLLYGPGFASATPVLRCLAPVPLLVGLSNLFGIQTMLPMGMKREFTAVLIASGVVNVALLTLLAPHWGAVGASTSVVVTEALVALAMKAVLWQRGVPLLGYGRKGRE